MQSEETPSFGLSGTWPLVKLLKGPLAMPDINQKSLSHRLTKIFNDAGYKVPASNFDGIQTGTKELQHLGVSTESPARILPENVDIPGTMAMAGFPSSSYNLRREALLPPIELQRLVFPSIESNPELLDPNQWKAHCDRVMLDLSPFSDEETAQGAGRQRRVAAANESIDEYAGVARLDHLHLLVWMRRIVLQDAALFIEDGATNRLLDHAVFQRAEFKKFRSDLLRAMGTDNSNQYEYQELHRELSSSTSLSESEVGQNRFSSSIEEPQQEEVAGHWVSHGNWHELRKRPKAKARSEDGKQESLLQQQQLQEQVEALQRQVEEQASTMRQMEQQEMERQQREEAYRDQQKHLLDQLSQQTQLTQKLWQRLELQQTMFVPRSPMSPPADGVATEDQSLDLIVLDRTLQIQTSPLGRVAPTTMVGAIPERPLHLQDALAEHTAPKSIPGPMPEKTLQKLNSPGRAVNYSILDPQSTQTQPMQGVPSGRVAIISDGYGLSSEHARPMQTPPGLVSASNPDSTLAPKFRRQNSSGGVIKRKSHVKWSRRPKTATQVTSLGTLQAQEVYCLCRGPDDGGFMVACDKCDGRCNLSFSYYMYLF